MYRKSKPERHAEDEELLEVQSAISVVSKRLARKLMQIRKGGQPYGTSEKSCRYRRRASRMQ